MAGDDFHAVTDSTPAITWRGEHITPERIVKLFVGGADKRFKNRTARILACRGLRRGTLEVKLDAKFVAKNPEIADWCVSKLEQRETLERELIAKAGATEPHFSRTPLKTTETARSQAEEFEAYENEVFAKSVPFQEMLEKGVEDGEFGWCALPSEIDSGGMPDFYDRLDDLAYAELDDDTKSEYSKDEDDRRGRFVRRDKDGNKRPNPAYSRDKAGKPTTRDEDRDDEKSDEAHRAAVRDYLLGCDATTTRVIPALDCVPLQTRGRGRKKWETTGIIERTLFEPEELVELGYGYACMGNKLALPTGFKPDWSSTDGQFYLYSMYLCLTDDKGVKRPMVAYTVGGAGTTWGGGMTGNVSADQVAVIDLYKEYGLEGPLWGYEYALHTADDDPDWYGRPYLWAFLRRILAIEGLQTANSAATVVSAYTGHYHRIDGPTIETLERLDPEAIVDLATHELRKPVVPGAGEIETVTGEVVPAEQARIGPDAWRLLDTHTMALEKATMIDQMPASGPSGHAMLVSESLGQVAKRHVRESAMRASEGALACDAKIRQAVFLKFGVRWPIHTTTERPVGLDTVEQQTFAEFDPEWVGNPERVREGNYSLSGSFPKEFNLARADLEINGYLKGVRALKHVAEAFGEPDPMALRFELAKDELWKAPESQAFLRSLVQKQRGQLRAEQAAALQNDGRMTRAGIPGAEAGVPAAMLRRAGEQGATPGPGKAPMAASVRGGITAAEMQGAEMAANAAGAMGVS